jgi:thiol-disulfide isomerase/thioredoxin
MFVPCIRRAGLLMAASALLLSLTISSAARAAPPASPKAPAPPAPPATTKPAEPPTDAQIEEMVAAFNKWGEETPRDQMTRENWEKFLAELLKDLNIEEMSAAQFAMASNLLRGGSEEITERARKRLDTIAAQNDLDGALASVMYVEMSLRPLRDDPALGVALRRAMTHPELAEAVKTDTGGRVFSLVGYVGKDVIKDLAQEVIDLHKVLSEDSSRSALFGATNYVMALNDLGDAADPTTKKAVRERVAHLFESAIAKVSAGDDPNKDKIVKSYTNSLNFLNGAYARGELIDHAAPALTFLWSDGVGGQPIKSLGDFKGKVVVLDFWATWCGPCIASFPSVGELQKHYEGYEVAIIGITSLQGKHYPGDGEPVVTEGNPQKEYELMQEFMKAKDMTWRIAFTEQEVFNPDFGVRGIPHIAIIDAEGIVRYNGLRPGIPGDTNALKEKAEKIDGLLKKAGLAMPASVEEVDETPDLR